MKKALLFVLQNTNMVLGSKFRDWSSQRQNNQASAEKLWRGKVLSCKIPTAPQTQHLVWPLCKTGERFQWWRNMDGSTTTWQPCWLLLLNPWCTDIFFIHKNVKIWESNLQEPARDCLVNQGCHLQEEPACTEGRRGLSRRRIFPKSFKSSSN